MYQVILALQGNLPDQQSEIYLLLNGDPIKSPNNAITAYPTI